ncbi:ABC transporter permease [Gracilimonas mengyeensis]|uniref:Lipoprotein-releasing system permease protein n=1 Tax=Gracilimonas mengyeensis TaxID=1302730 RepID=A0A521EZ69_9BACT|nr:ABC transporter permease [Gracilimonas mengyeensis]SMO89248.1 lipoprotein-releasing system permease protein [Gracilimonas mengyeensis]
MKFEWYLALRYFKGSRKGSGFLSFIKYMSIAGVAIGAAGLLIALSVVHGFKSTINGKIMDFAPHITLVSYAGSPIHRADTLLTALDQFPEIETKQAIIQGQVMVQTRDAVNGTALKGVDLEEPEYGISGYITKGTYQLGADSTGMPGIVMGAKLAESLQAEIGSVITSYTIEGIPSLINSPEIKQFRLNAIYETGIERFDDTFALVARDHARQLFSYRSNQADGIEIRVSNPEQIPAVRQKLEEEIGFPYFPETIYGVFANIFAWVELQENMIPLVISGMIIVAAFNLIGAILMMVLERTRDIGILKTMGSKSKTIRRVFMLEGLFVAGVGLSIGIAISLLFYFLQTNYQIIPLSQENYYMSYAPVEPHALDFLIVSLVTFLLCALASWIPARVAANTDPVKVISFGR